MTSKEKGGLGNREKEKGGRRVLSVGFWVAIETDFHQVTQKGKDEKNSMEADSSEEKYPRAGSREP